MFSNNQAKWVSFLKNFVYIAIILIFGVRCTKQVSKTNIIFIITDDQGPWALGSNGPWALTDSEDPNFLTPNIDRLFHEGAYLKNCFTVTPVCSPSRGNIVTSLYSTEFGITDYISPERQPELGLDPDYLTWPEIINKNGYETALIGKWHLGQMDKYHPTQFGYQEFKGFRVGGKISKDPEVEVNREVKQINGYTPDILTDFAIDFIRRKKDRPFLLSLHYWAPHANTANFTPEGDRTWLPLSDADWENLFKNYDPKLPQPDYPNLDIPRTKRMMKEYLGSVHSVDRNIGRILKVLDELHLSENTVIIFTSDHGYNMGHHGIWHKGNGRWLLVNNQGPRPNLYDNSLRVPAIIRWPGIIPADTVIHETITYLDWYPTILAIAGIPTPEDAKIRGRNFLPLLKGESIPWDNDLFAQYSEWDWNQTGAKLRTYRTKNWKLVRDFKHEGKDEFYNLKDDPQERENLINSKSLKIQTQIERLNKKLIEKMEYINDPCLQMNK